MIDFHSHILPNIDDGPKDIEQSVAMAAVLHEAGVNIIYGTPHLMKGCFDADKDTVISAVATLQERLNKENIDMKILPGREYYLDEFLDSYLQDPLPLGETKFIMIEIPNNAAEEYVKESCFKIKRAGFIPMIAHPERCRLFATPQKKTASFFSFSDRKQKNENPGTEEAPLIDYPQEIGCAFQGNLGSFEEFYGTEVTQAANELKKRGIFTHYGTDAHSLKALHHLKPVLNYLKT